MEAPLRRIVVGGPWRQLAGLGLICVQLLPIIAGLFYIILPSLGHLPAIAETGFSLEPWVVAAREPGLLRSIGTTLLSGLPATLISLALAIAITARLAPMGEIIRPARRGAFSCLQMIVAVPPVALAIGIAFVIAPSGWILRLLASVMDWTEPPQWSLPRDPWGLSLGFALILKETPFFSLAALAALHQMRPQARLMSAIGLGYAPGCAWVKIVLPELLSRLRWPIFAVLAYALSAVDLATLLGPTTPPTLAVLIADLGRDPDLTRRMPAAALAIIELLLVGASWLLWLATARLVEHLFHPWMLAGTRELPRVIAIPGRAIVGVTTIVAAIVVILALLSLPTWSLATIWLFPDFWPSCCSLENWARTFDAFLMPLFWSLCLAVGSSVLALLAAILYFTLEPNFGRSLRRWTWTALFVPLITPDIAFLLGAQVFFLTIGWRMGWLPVLWTHFMFVFPYVLLVLAEAWRRLDPRYERIAACLGLGPWRRLLKVRLALLRPTLFFAGALGAAVSLSLYLPTLLLGGGRVATLATEAVALASGGDRRVTGVYGSLQTIIAVIPFAWAMLAIRHRMPSRGEGRG